MSKTRINISIDVNISKNEDLADFARLFTEENRTTVADIVTQFFLNMKRWIDGDKTEEIMANPFFQKAMLEMQEKLQKGTAQWHSYDEVFGL